MEFYQPQRQLERSMGFYLSQRERMLVMGGIHIDFYGIMSAASGEVDGNLFKRTLVMEGIRTDVSGIISVAAAAGDINGIICITVGEDAHDGRDYELTLMGLCQSQWQWDRSWGLYSPRDGRDAN